MKMDSRLTILWIEGLKNGKHDKGEECFSVNEFKG